MLFDKNRLSRLRESTKKYERKYCFDKARSNRVQGLTQVCLESVKNVVTRNCSSRVQGLTQVRLKRIKNCALDKRRSSVLQGLTQIRPKRMNKLVVDRSRSRRSQGLTQFRRKSAKRIVWTKVARVVYKD